MPKSGRFEPPLRRVLAVDAGSRCVRLLLLESRFGRLRLAGREVLDLEAEGLVSAEEVKSHVQAIVAAWGRPPIALALPQHVAVSQSVDLPPTSERDARSLIEAETLKLGGVSESAIVYDFVRLPAPDDQRHRFWVTFCQEGEIRARIAQLGLEGEDFREVTTAANALLTAWDHLRPQNPRAVLVHAGAQNTTVVIALHRTGVFATSFPMGGDFLTRTIARLRQCPPAAAETLKRGQDLLDGPDRLAGLAEAVDGWAAELKRQLNDWRERHSGEAGDFADFDLLASGGMFEQPGLLAYLKTRTGLRLERWPAGRAAGALAWVPGFEIALGTALQALGFSSQPVSLLPAERRAGWQRRLGRQRLEFANAFVLVLVALALGFGVWQKLALIRYKEAFKAKVDAAIDSAQANAALTRDLLTEFNTLRPLFERQQNTVDTLHTLARLQQTRGQHDFWYVLLADQQSYFTPSAAAASTNQPAALAGFAGPRSLAATNASPAKPGFIAELCVPGSPDDARRTLSAVVNELKTDATFARVDLLSEDLRRNLADPKVLVPDRHFALALDFANTEFQRRADLKTPRLPATGRGAPRSASPAETGFGDEP
jgi:Tfp pilus assembly PilM family ATPase